MSNQENKQEKQDLPADLAPKPSPEKPPVKITAPASKKVKNPKRVAAGKALTAKKQREAHKNKGF